jgi:methylaspartate ammonia-lyase
MVAPVAGGHDPCQNTGPRGINNTIDPLRYVRSKNLVVYCGGTCNETDVSARVCTHVAMACGADQVLAKPGIGADEA